MNDWIVLVADHPRQTRNLQLELEAYGLLVKLVESRHVQEAMLHSQSARAIVLAIDVPERNGYALCATFKNNPQTAHIPIILVSRSDKTGAVLDAFRAGVEDYIIYDTFASYNVVEALRDLDRIQTR